MYQLLIVLLMLNLSVFGWNMALSPQARYERPPLLEPGSPELELRDDVVKAAYSSSTANTQSSCYTLGPYNSLKAAQLVADKIHAFGLAANIRTLRSLETLNFLVYIPPLASPKQAQMTAQDIGKFDIQDVVIINEGPYKNAISLGFFNNLNKAKRHAEYIRYLGYDARYTEQQAPREVYWLDYDEPFGSNTPVQAWSASIDKTSDVQRIPRACH